jgi:hypothetical protein
VQALLGDDNSRARFIEDVSQAIDVLERPLGHDFVSIGGACDECVIC